LLNRAWTFRFRGSTGRSLGAFLALFAVCYGLNLAVLLLLRDVVWVSPWLAQAAALMAYTAAFYVGSSRLVFR
jgi:putative flippase GtrA